MDRRRFLRAMIAGVGLIGSGSAWGSLWPPRPASVIKRALARRQTLELRYQGHVRIVEPHALGRMRDGREALLAWQSAGGSRSEPPTGWRLFVVAEIAELNTGKSAFQPRPDFRPERTALTRVIAEVSVGKDR